MKKREHGLGAVKPIRNRTTGEIVGYRAFLPRELSKAPDGVKNKKNYQQPIGDPVSTEEEAREMLRLVVTRLLEPDAVKHGLPFSTLVDAEIRARHMQARRKYSSDARASKAVSTWRSIDRRWLQEAPFYSMPPEVISAEDIQRYVDYLRDEAEGQSGEPLSTHFIRNVGRLIRAAMARKGGTNPALAVTLPKKSDPEIHYLELTAQGRLFAAKDERGAASTIPLVDRIMVGCGMGAGLRVNELLSIEEHQVHVYDHDPHLVVRFGGSHHAPTKGERTRRVELYEPGLGFWRLYMERFYKGGRRVFEGPKGGYLKSWPEQFPAWAVVAGVDRLSSHIMRHTFAVSLLSGTWGYEPRSMEFVSQQLGHADIQTTQRYYAAFERGTWVREARRMTGRAEPERRTPITALELLGIESSNESSEVDSQPFLAAVGASRFDPRHSPELAENPKETPLNEALTPQAVARVAEDIRSAIALLASDSPTAPAEALRKLGDALRLADRLALLLKPEGATRVG
jgi:integrase